MEVKFCEHCQSNHDLTKELWYFSKKPDGRVVVNCKTFKNKKNNEYNKKNRAALLEKQRAAYHLNPGKAAEKRAKNSDKTKEYLKEYRSENKAKVRAANANWRAKNRERIREIQHQYYLENKDKWQGYKEEPSAVNARYVERYKSDKNFKLKANLRNRLRMALKTKAKVGSAVDLLGCSIEQAVAYLESKFYSHPITGEPMSWTNHTRLGWHIDHILPLDDFNLEDSKELAKACHYTNLQPLWAAQNAHKSNKIKNMLDVEKEISKLGLPMARVDSDNNIYGITNGAKDLYVRLIDLKPDCASGFEAVERFQDGRVIQLLPHEITELGDISMSMIRNFFGQSQKLDARNCTIRAIRSSEAREFFDKNHLMGHIMSARYFGLYYGEDLVSSVGFKKNGDGIEISRFATKINTMVRGAFSKLLSFLEKNVQLPDGSPKYIVSYCDLRYSDGASYIATGFELKGITQGFLWSDGYRTYNRLHCMANMDDRMLPEAAYAKERNLFKLFDAGQAKYLKVLK